MKNKSSANKQYKTKHAVPKGKKVGAGNGNMNKRHMIPTNVTRKRDDYNPVSIEEFESVKMENERLKQLNKTIQKENTKVISLARDGRVDNFDETFMTTVVATTNRIIYPICPYMSNPMQLEKCMVVLAAELQLPETKKKWFCVGFKHTVNSAIASRRNADIQCIRRELLGNRYKNLDFFRKKNFHS